MSAHYNVIAVLDERCEHVLMCTRGKPPYQGLLNLVGGKIECGEDGVCAAYRELWEETGIAKEDIGLVHLMDFTYHLPLLSLRYMPAVCGARWRCMARKTSLHGSPSGTISSI